MYVYEWDEAKRTANRAKHEVDFTAVAGFDWGTAIQRRDSRADYGEPRWIALGLIGDRLHVLVYTLRGTTIRVIGLRKANPREQRSYHHG